MTVWLCDSVTYENVSLTSLSCPIPSILGLSPSFLSLALSALSLTQTLLMRFHFFFRGSSELWDSIFRCSHPFVAPFSQLLIFNVKTVFFSWRPTPNDDRRQTFQNDFERKIYYNLYVCVYVFTAERMGSADHITLFDRCSLSVSYAITVFSCWLVLLVDLSKMLTTRARPAFVGFHYEKCIKRLST